MKIFAGLFGQRDLCDGNSFRQCSEPSRWVGIWE